MLTEVTYYGPRIVDRLTAALGGRSTQLWVARVWLCTLGPLWPPSARPPRDVPHRPTLKVPTGPGRYMSMTRQPPTAKEKQ